MPAKRIQNVCAFMNRNCPVLWIKPDTVWAERARDICGMKSKRGPYLDPDSDGNSFLLIKLVCGLSKLSYVSPAVLGLNNMQL